ncbi:PREDICTED: uncharacterized protein LOC104808772 [Tarenaya hassleriana]|uniref:uncharacterized protein LOC104808772 n=1 Tax=Tarenaya hassleriana TaxID=28532 RepID=UPI00053C8977|nr:PREDICTED: uncharacterized protein LOC104808772 [Tarenaya hassleriana]
MASSLYALNSLNPSSSIPKFNQTLTHISNYLYLSPCSVLRLKHRPFHSSGIRFSPLGTRRARSRTVVLSVQSNFMKVLRTAWNIGRDGIEAGTNLIPESVPRPVARVSVTIAASMVSLFVLKSFLSTAFFVLGTMGFAYFLFIALNKGDGPRPGGGSSSGSEPMEDPLDEARKIMDKYK